MDQLNNFKSQKFDKMNNQLNNLNSYKNVI